MVKYSGKLGDIFGKAYNDKRPKMADVFEDLSNAYEGHMEFFIVKHVNDVYVVGTGLGHFEDTQVSFLCLYLR